MSKKQLLVLTLVASIPAAGLLLKMLFSLLHLLSDQSNATVLLWIIYVVCLLGSAFIAFLPLLLWLYYPAAGFTNSASANVVAQGSGTDFGVKAAAVGDDEDASEEEEFLDDHAVEDDGEALFDEDAMEEDFDEFDGGFDDPDKK